MTSASGPVEGVEPDAPSAPVPEAAPRRRGLRGRLLRLAAVVLGVIVVGVLLDAVTASPRLCMSCHEMLGRADAWQRSPHAGVPCVSCHQPARPWYAAPLRIADRVALLSRDVTKHLAGGYPDPVDVRGAGTPRIKDDVCLQCHDPNRKTTSGMRILIDHVAHAKRNGSCISCHIRTAHPIATRGAALSLMSQCFTCHGWAPSAKAPARCGLCHPESYRLRPQSHGTATWKRGGHGVLAIADRKSCEMCHEKNTCDGCHGIDMPHPMGWAKAGHAQAAAKGRGVCDGCHWGYPDMCSVCHHKGYDPAQGTWLDQHVPVSKKLGAAACAGCHPKPDCAPCHRK